MKNGAEKKIQRRFSLIVKNRERQSQMTHQSYHHKMFLKAEEENKVAREEMEKRNLAQMEELAKEQPTPTIAEVQKALGVTPKVEEPEAPKSPVEEPKTDDEPKPIEEKASTPENAQGGNYKTRQSHARR